MVSKLLIWILLSSFSVQAATPLLIPSGLHLSWEGEKSPKCQHLVEVFLTELRSMAADHVIELEVDKNDGKKETINSHLTDSAIENDTQKTLRSLHLKCEQDSENILEVKDEESTLKMHYLVKASGFDSMDWIPFQEKYLRLSPMNTESNLSLSDHQRDRFIALPVTQSFEKKEPVFQQWWFWGLVGAVVAGGAYLLTRSNGKTSGVTMEIH